MRCRQLSTRSAQWTSAWTAQRGRDPGAEGQGTAAWGANGAGLPPPPISGRPSCLGWGRGSSPICPLSRAVCAATLCKASASAWGPEASLGCGPGSPACLIRGWILPRRGQRRRGGSAETSVTGGRPGAGETWLPLVSCGAARALRGCGAPWGWPWEEGLLGTDSPGQVGRAGLGAPEEEGPGLAVPLPPAAQSSYPYLCPCSPEGHWPDNPLEALAQAPPPPQLL